MLSEYLNMCFPLQLNTLGHNNSVFQHCLGFSFVGNQYGIVYTTVTLYSTNHVILTPSDLMLIQQHALPRQPLQSLVLGSKLL